MHYLVGVITKENPVTAPIFLEKALEPYYEGLEIEPEIVWSKEEVIKNYLECMKEKNKEIDSSNEEDLYEKAREYYDNEEYDEEGNMIAYYNPNSKWDWWTIGGRWSGGFFNGQDTIQLKDFPENIDTSLPEEELIKLYPKEYEDYEKLTKKGTDYCKPEYYQKAYPDFATYLVKVIVATTYAVLDENGEWHEPGEMGWFSSSATYEQQIEFNNNYYKNFIENKDKNLYFTLVDCHI